MNETLAIITRFIADSTLFIVGSYTVLMNLPLLLSITLVAGYVYLVYVTEPLYNDLDQE